MSVSAICFLLAIILFLVAVIPGVPNQPLTNLGLAALALGALFGDVRGFP